MYHEIDLKVEILKNNTLFTWIGGTHFKKTLLNTKLSEFVEINKSEEEIKEYIYQIKNLIKSCLDLKV